MAPSPSNFEPCIHCPAKSPGSHSSSPHAHPHHFFHSHMCNAQNSWGKDNHELWQDHNKLWMGYISNSWGGIQTNPLLQTVMQQTCSFKGPRLCCSHCSLGGALTDKPVIVWFTACYLVYYFWFITFVYTITYWPLKFSFSTDSTIYLVFVLLYMTFPNDSTRLQESKQ